MPYVRRLRIGAVIVDRHVAIRALRAHGFAVEFHDPGAPTWSGRDGGPSRRKIAPCTAVAVVTARPNAAAVPISGSASASTKQKAAKP